ncbi:nitroreductase [Moniliophthora roreri]|uniref:Nitroreductase domain-containing protein n=1 Tax=Moniliophthora roreri TaxID=221103 RepID=A0A0W0F4Z0_MONRR|nr:nitroreductase [Moniliophthora roreri]
MAILESANLHDTAAITVVKKTHTNGNTSETERQIQTAININFIDALMKTRYSCRYYLPNPVPKHIVEEIIDAARFAPSGNNMQPWHKVYCLAGPTKDAVCKAILSAHTQDPTKHQSQYRYNPAPDVLPDIYAERRSDSGKVYYGSLGIPKEDKEGRAMASDRNYEFYGAPVAFVFTIHKDLTQGSWLDVGYFIQSIHIASAARGLGSISQESISQYHTIFRQYLPVSDDEIVVLGMAMGYPDLDKVNKYVARQPKREVWEIVDFHGF